MTAEFHLQLLGTFALRHGGLLVPLQPQARRVLAFVALAPKSITRSAVAANLWPLRPEAGGHAALRAALWHIEHRAPGVLRHCRTTIALDDATRTDLDTFNEALSGIDAEADERLADVSIFRHDLLEDMDEDWLAFERERMRQRRLHALDRLALAEARRGQYGAAIEAALAAVAAEPLRESAQRTLITVHLAEGNVVEARRQFERFSQVLSDELALEPSPELAAIIRAT